MLVNVIVLQSKKVNFKCNHITVAGEIYMAVSNNSFVHRKYYIVKVTVKI